MTQPLLKPWQAVAGGITLILAAQLIVGYLVAGDDSAPTLGGTPQDAIQICRDEIIGQIPRPDTAHWTAPRVARDGDAYYRVAGSVNGDLYSCHMHHQDGDWRIISAGLDE